MKELELEESSSGIFKELIKGEVSELIGKFLVSGNVDRFEIIKYFKESAEVTDKIRPGLMFRRENFVERMVDSFEEASGLRGKVTRLEALLDTKPNLVKTIANHTRVGRMFDDLYRIPYVLKLDYMPTFSTLPMLINTMLVTYGDEKGANNKYSGLLLTALLSTYAKKIAVIDYPAMWFVVCFAKNISCNSILPPDTLKEHPELEEYAKPIINLVSRLNETYSESLKNATEDDLYRVNEPSTDELDIDEPIHTDNKS